MQDKRTKNKNQSSGAQKSRHPLLAELDADEIFAAYGSNLDRRAAGKKKEMKVSGKSVFKLREIIGKKGQRRSK